MIGLMIYAETTRLDHEANKQYVRNIALLRTICLLAVLSMGSTSLSSAHEYYLMPESFTPNDGVEFSVRHRLGQKFKGNELPFINRWNIRSETWKDGEKKSVRGQDGDRPALKVTGRGKGLMSVVHQSNVDFLTFKTWEKFKAYVTKEGLAHALQPSLQGTKPKVDLIEGYARYAKTLIALGGDVSGTDRPTGLKIELVALAHPLALNAAEPMPVQLLYEGEALEGARIKVFVGIGTEFAYQIESDREGKALIPARGPGPYLLNAIHMTEPQGKEAKDKKAHWESFWASLTFQRGN
ncbi:MAG: DUF4198 domain-containing protein [Rhizobiaceae bacterium]|nr:DUF4198 domain-containing protein [Rhizobiaceae bacterium]